MSQQLSRKGHFTAVVPKGPIVDRSSKYTVAWTQMTARVTGMVAKEALMCDGWRRGDMLIQVTW